MDSSEDKKTGDININIGGGLSGKQIALGSNINQTQSQGDPHTEEADEELDLALPIGRAQIVQLRHILTTYFSEAELRTLAFDLNVNFGGLPGRGLSAKVHEMILYLIRRGRLHDLLAAGRLERPDIAWPNDPES